MSQEEFTECFRKALMDERVQNLLQAALSSKTDRHQREVDHKEQQKCTANDEQTNFEVSSQLVKISDESNKHCLSSTNSSAELDVQAERVQDEPKVVPNSPCNSTVVPHYRAKRENTPVHHKTKQRMKEGRLTTIVDLSHKQDQRRAAKWHITWNKFQENQELILHFVKDRGKSLQTKEVTDNNL